MIEAATWIVCFWWLSLGPNEGPLIQMIAGSDALEHQLLPTSELQESLSPLWLVPHGRADWPKFFYVPAENWQTRRPALLLGTERLLAPLRVPRLFVSQEYLQDGRLARGFKAIEPLAVDQADAILKVLVEIHLRRALLRAPDLDTWLTARAQELMKEAPAESRRETYISAQIDFAAHLLSIAHEIGRHQRRKEDGALCALLAHPASLFGFWRRVVEQGAYPGMYKSAGADSSLPGFGSGGRWRMTRAVLVEQDKLWVMEHFLGDRWTGDPERDFAFLCRP